MDKQTQTELEAAAFRRLVQHLRENTEVQNIDLMNLAGFCRNCLSKWYRAAAEERGVALLLPVDVVVGGSLRDTEGRVVAVTEIGRHDDDRAGERSREPASDPPQADEAAAAPRRSPTDDQRVAVPLSDRGLEPVLRRRRLDRRPQSSTR